MSNIRLFLSSLVACGIFSALNCAENIAHRNVNILNATGKTVVVGVHSRNNRSYTPPPVTLVPEAMCNLQLHSNTASIMVRPENKNRDATFSPPPGSGFGIIVHDNNNSPRIIDGINNEE